MSRPLRLGLIRSPYPLTPNNAVPRPMTADNNPNKPDQDRPARGNDHGRRAQRDTPAWTDGLKQLYDSVVDEPLPDAFMDLLAQFDDGDDGSSANGGKHA